MRRTTMGILALVLSLSVGLVSCDQLFDANFFAKATHPPVSESQIAAKSAAEIGDLLESAEYRAQLSESESLRDAVLTRLEAIYNDANTDLATAQEAAMLAAGFRIDSDPAAAYVSSAVLGAISSLSSNSIAPSDVGSIVKGLVPPDILAEIDAGAATPPQAFIDMIAAFQDASTAFAWLGSNLSTVIDPKSGATVYAYAADVPPDEALPIAVNALLSGLLSTIKTATFQTDPALVAGALWRAIQAPPEEAGDYLYVETTVIEGLVSSGIYVANLLEAAGFSFDLSSGGSL